MQASELRGTLRTKESSVGSTVAQADDSRIFIPANPLNTVVNQELLTT